MISRKEIAEWIENTYGSTEDIALKVAALSTMHKIYNSIEEPSEDKDNPWAWVKTEYVELFKEKNKDKGGHVREATSRMKKLFAAYPHIRKEDVLNTVKLYLSETDYRYIRLPHYFLKKGVGANAIYEFDTWYDKYKESLSIGEGRVSKTNTMQ